MKQETLTKLNDLIQKETILWGTITKLGRKDSEAFMEGPMPKKAGLSEPVSVVIMDHEVDGEENHGSLVRFIGRRRVPYTILKVEDDVVYGSRRAAQELLKASMLQNLIDKKEFTGEIVGIAPYGAYVEVNGVSGLLRNNDATSDHSEVSEHFRNGDTVTVVCRDITPSGRINWELPVKLHRQGPIELDFEEDTVVTAVVSSITTFKNSTGVGVFARVSKGVDALCAMPEFEVYPGQRVAVKIIRIIRDPEDQAAAPKVRGKIIRTL